MRYILVKWENESVGDPDLIYIEINSYFWEQRKVEIFRDGRIGYADENEEVGSSMLAIEPWDDLDKIAHEPEFEIKEISREEFEIVWQRAKGMAIFE